MPFISKAQEYVIIWFLNRFHVKFYWEHTAPQARSTVKMCTGSQYELWWNIFCGKGLLIFVRCVLHDCEWLEVYFVIVLSRCVLMWRHPRSCTKEWRWRKITTGLHYRRATKTQQSRPSKRTLAPTCFHSVQLILWSSHRVVPWDFC